MICPCCKKEVERDHFACCWASKGGAAGRGKVKSRSSEQCRAAVKARWDRERERKRVVVPEGFGSLEPKIEPEGGV